MLTKNYKYRYLPYIKILKQKIKFLERKKIKQNKSIHVTMFKGFLKNVPDYSFLKKTTCLIRICNTRKKKVSPQLNYWSFLSCTFIIELQWRTATQVVKRSKKTVCLLKGWEETEGFTVNFSNFNTTFCLQNQIFWAEQSWRLRPFAPPRPWRVTTGTNEVARI